MTTTESTYRNSSISGASPIGLMIALFDRLVADFQRAVAALRKGDIEARCREMNHAALVLARLESWLDSENGGESARDLARFYSYLRVKMLDAAAKQSAEILEAQIGLILHIRSAWQQLDLLPPQELHQFAGSAAPSANVAYAPEPEVVTERIPFSQTA